MEITAGRIYQGDCLGVMSQWPAASFDFVLTDPPYLIDYQSRMENKAMPIANDGAVGDWVLPAYREIARLLKPDSFCVSFYGFPHVEKFMTAWKSVGLMPKGHLVFIKNNFGLGYLTRHQHESAYLLAKGEPERLNTAVSDVYEWKGTGNELHPTQKPVSAMANIIRTFTRTDALVLDPFAGSGSTLLACEMAGRPWVGIELDDGHARVAQERIDRERSQLKLF